MNLKIHIIKIINQMTKLRLFFLILFCVSLHGLFAQINWQNDSWEVISATSSGGTTTFNSSGTFSITNLKKIGTTGKQYRADLRYLKEIKFTDAEQFLVMKIKTTNCEIINQAAPNDYIKLNLLNLEYNASGVQTGLNKSNIRPSQFYYEPDSSFYTVVWDLKAIMGTYFQDGLIMPFAPNWTNGTNPGSIRAYLAFVLIMNTATTTDVPSYEVYKIKTYPTVLAANNDKSTESERKIADSGEYQQIIIYGQSLAMGWQAPQAITTTSIADNFMLGSSPIMLYNNQSPTLNPLVATRWQNGGEQPIVSCVNVFAEKYRSTVNSATKFIGMTAGEGGRTIERLSKECTNNGYYNSTFIKILDNTLIALEGSNSTIKCPAIVYMQGEYNYSTSGASGQGLTPGTNGTTNKNEYKQLLLTLKNNMQSDIMAKYGQTEKPLFFIYQTSGGYVANKEMSISMAQFEFAQENEDVVLLNPHYALPDYTGGHLSTNGYRWYGEIIGNILNKVLIEKQAYKPIFPEKFVFDKNTITIDFHVPFPPLEIDTYTTPEVNTYGFSVKKIGQSTNLISKVEILDGNKVKISCIEDLTGIVEINYGGPDIKGTGNLCDSYTSNSMYTYFDDSNASLKETYTPKDILLNNLYGKKYPLKNWCVGFYYQLDVDSNSTELKTFSSNASSYFDSKSNVFYNKNVVPGGFITIFDLNGRMILKTSGLETKLNLSSLHRGSYIVNNGIEQVLINKCF